MCKINIFSPNLPNFPFVHAICAYFHLFPHSRSASTIDNGHAVMAASAASELGSVQSHAGEVRPLGSASVSFRNPSSASNNLNNIRNFLFRIRHGGRVLRGQQDNSPDA